MGENQVDYRIFVRHFQFELTFGSGKCDAPTRHPKGCQVRVSHFGIGTL